ncbi:aldehyde dehydrogenase (plasmid) [Rhodococcus erythropolis R138]|uniref:aldehyde dehydrogenase n=1 Tax=Rhodococcus erythropolis TaxID=1833 RepID=UPI0004A8766F|nr:aldehyde dehydrogenase [Rhodococcus erythropolis]ALU73519.1 aldehyde dehydrogenase [Rhodococcus erythropolis R138]
MTDLNFTRTELFIGGRWCAPISTDSYELVEASTGKPLGSVPLGARGDIDAAVAAARAAFDDGPWGRTTPAERAEMLRRFAAELQSRGEATAELISRENGSPLATSYGANVSVPVATLNQYAAMAESGWFEDLRDTYLGATVVRKVPVGVVAAIIPWNFPHLIAMAKLAPALAAGCTVVVKPSPETALDAFVLADAAEAAGLPAGVINVVPADRDVSAALVAHPDVDKVTFTGSTAAGRLISEVCGRLMRPVTLELGGKSASIVLEDADLDVFEANLAATSFVNNGQACVLLSRILAPRSRYDQVVDVVARVAKSLVVGDALDPAVTCGPMAGRVHRDRVLGYIEEAKTSGARLVTGGGVPEGLEDGWFVEPTVFADVDNTSRLAQEEVFGPVIAVIAYDDLDEAVAIANDSDYGLAGAVWTADERRGVDVARRIRTGTVGVNYYQMDLGAPFGGVKASGLGREFGVEGMTPYIEYQSVYVSADYKAGEPQLNL